MATTSPAALDRLAGELGENYVQQRGSQTSEKSVYKMSNVEKEDLLKDVLHAGRTCRTRSNALDVETLSPRRAKRIIANREAAHRSRVKKLKYISDMEDEVSRLEEENLNVQTHLTGAQQHNAALQDEQRKLRKHVELLQQEEYLMRTNNAALVQRLDLTLI